MVTDVIASSQPSGSVCANEAVFSLSPHPPQDWDRFVSGYTHCFFYYSQWHKILERGYRVKSLYCSLSANLTTLIGISGIVFDFKFYKLFFSDVPYGGIIGNLNYYNKFIHCMETALKKEGIHQIRMTQIASLPYPQPANYEVKKAWQHCLDFQGKTLDQIWKSYRKNTRRDINKAKKSNIRVCSIQNKAELNNYYTLYCATMNRNASINHYTRQLYDEIYDHLIEVGKADILFAELNGRMIAGVLLIFSDDTAYLLGSVSDPNYLRFCPNDLLYQTVIELIIAKKMRFFDLMMSEENDHALIWFKEKWGSAREPFTIFKKDLSSWHSKLWNFAWKCAHTSIGNKFLQFARGNY